MMVSVRAARAETFQSRILTTREMGTEMSWIFTCSGFHTPGYLSNLCVLTPAQDYEFVVYKSSPWNIYIDNGIMTIKAFLSEDKYGPGWVSNGTMFVKRCAIESRDEREDALRTQHCAEGIQKSFENAPPVRRCTASDRELCERTAFSYNILPPVRSARVHTANAFAFRYGVVEMRVRGPRGDWLYPRE